MSKLVYVVRMRCDENLATAEVLVAECYVVQDDGGLAHSSDRQSARKGCAFRGHADNKGPRSAGDGASGCRARHRDGHVRASTSPAPHLITCAPLQQHVAAEYLRQARVGDGDSSRPRSRHHHQKLEEDRAGNGGRKHS